eukprot:TRINITY_DN19427_c0_g1_i3.p1 TRINITY_DN19427_c0_g1~~TRINITY_DN19427_c0_g1_i3.p1  ORF type:complete len:218 (+),score=34.04 TRINITY_DN19427_c0_g1_i3:348-1001(+)
MEAALQTYDYLVKLNQNFVLSMGHSMGCALALHVAIERQNSKYLLGATLRSPFTSVCAVKICPCPTWLCCGCTRGLHKCCCFASCCDMLRSIDVIQDCAVPVWFIHSLTDELIPKDHSEMLAGEAPASYGIWYLDQGESHAAFPINSQMFLLKFTEFIQHCVEQRQQNVTPEQVLLEDDDTGSYGTVGPSPGRAGADLEPNVMQPLMRQGTKRYQHG